MKRHYSVRQSVEFPNKFKVVIAGKKGWWSSNYSDIDVPLFDTWQEALSAAERLNKLVPIED